MSEPAPPSLIDEHPAARLGRLALVGLALAAMILWRMAAGSGELWLDEVWTCQRIVSDVQLPEDILLKVREENNHFLNTFFVWLVGPASDEWLIRLPSMLAGWLTVLAGTWYASRRSVAAGVLALLFLGNSYLLVHYSSEARGYSFAVCAAVLCLAIADSTLERPAWWKDCLFAFCATLGFLSQAVFLSFEAALAVWMGWRCARTGRWDQAARCHCIPLAAFTLLYFVNLKWAQNAGGPVYSPVSVVAETASLAVGGPLLGVGMWVCGALALAAAAFCIWWSPPLTGTDEQQPVRNRASRPEQVFLVLAIVGFPLLLLLLTGRREIYPRYFLISVALLLLVWARWLGEFWNSGPWPRALVAVLAGLSIAGHVRHDLRLVTLGRNSYLPLIDKLAESTQNPRVTVGLDQQFRHGMMLAYYQQYRGYQPRGVMIEPISGGTPEWLLLHEIELDAPPFRPAIVSQGQTYRLEYQSRYAGLSGWSLAAYRRISKLESDPVAGHFAR